MSEKREKSMLEEMAASLAEMQAKLEELERQRDEGKRRRKANPNWLKSGSELPWKKWMPRFLEVLGATGNISAARRAIREHVKSSSTPYAYKNRCEAFHDAWISAEEMAARSQPG